MTSPRAAAVLVRSCTNKRGQDNTSNPDGHTTQSEHLSRAALSNDSTCGAGTDASRAGTDTSEVKLSSVDGPQGLISNSDDQETEPMRDAGGGKVRGPNGRYLPKEDVLSSPKPMKKPTGKGYKLSVKAADQSESSFCVMARPAGWWRCLWD